MEQSTPALNTTRVVVAILLVGVPWLLAARQAIRYFTATTTVDVSSVSGTSIEDVTVALGESRCVIPELAADSTERCSLRADETAFFPELTLRGADGGAATIELEHHQVRGVSQYVSVRIHGDGGVTSNAFIQSDVPPKCPPPCSAICAGRAAPTFPADCPQPVCFCSAGSVTE